MRGAYTLQAGGRGEGGEGTGGRRVEEEGMIERDGSVTLDW